MSDRIATVLRSDTFAANRAEGRVALTVNNNHAMTRRSHVREEGSLRLRFPTPAAAHLEAVIVNTAGGIAGGDRLDIAIELGDGARLSVTSAAAEKIYRSLGPDARLDVRLRLGAQSSLLWLPQELILFNEVRLRRSIEVEMASSANLVLAEMSIFGRSAMGERLEHGSLFDRWRVRREGKLIFAETVRLEGAIAEKLSQCAVASGSAAVATLLLVPGGEALAEKLRALGPDFRGEVAASAWNGITLARFLGLDGAQVRHDLARALTELDVSLPRLWLN
jgi:urease accessory protein